MRDFIPTTVVFCDVETGGLDPHKHSVLSVGLCVASIGYDGSLHTANFGDWFVREPDACLGDTVTEAALKINGLSMAQILRVGFHPAQVMDQINTALDAAVNEDCAVTLGGQNFGAFDYQFFKRWERQYGIKLRRHQHRFVDTATIIHMMKSVRMLPPEVRSLVDACKALNLPFEDHDFHTAVKDAEASARIWHWFVQHVGEGALL